jgi:anti-anti-sigma factor
MPEPYGIEVVPSGDNGIRLCVSGEVDLANAQMLFEAMTSALLKPMQEVIVDLSEVTFMDSTGLAALVGAHRLLLDDQVRLVVMNPSRQVSHLMDVAGLGGYLSIEGGWVND